MVRTKASATEIYRQYYRRVDSQDPLAVFEITDQGLWSETLTSRDAAMDKGGSCGPSPLVRIRNGALVVWPNALPRARPVRSGYNRGLSWAAWLNGRSFGGNMSATPDRQQLLGSNERTLDAACT